MTNRPEIKPLTALRMIAALLVLFHHYYHPVLFDQSLLEAVLVQGHIGVTIFFTLSGFLITLRYYDDFRQGFSRKLLFSYFSKRIARIYPLYFVVLLVALLGHSASFFSTGTLIVITLTQSFFVDYRFYGIATAWSLSLEEWFYLLAVFVYTTLVAAQRKIQSKPTLASAIALGVLIVWVVSLLGVGLLLMAWATSWTSNPAGFMNDTRHFFMYTIFARFFDFAIGILAALLVMRGQAAFIITYPRMAMLAGLGCLVGLALVQHRMHFNGGYAILSAWRLNFLVAPLTGVLIVALTNPHTLLARILSRGLFVYLGRISYALYLIQATNIAKPVQELIEPFRHSPLLYAMFAYIGLNLLAALLYEWVEQPARETVLRWAKRLEPYFTPGSRPATAAPVELSSGESSV